MKKALFIVTALSLYDRQGASYNRILAYAKALTFDKNTIVFLISYDYPDNLGISKSEIVPDVFICGKQGENKNRGSFLTRTFKKQFDAKKRTRFLTNLDTFIDQYSCKKTGLVYPSLMGYQLEKKIIRLFRIKNIPVFSERNELKRGIALNKAFPGNPVKKIIFGLIYLYLIWDSHRQDRLAKYYDGNIAISTTMEHYLKKMNNNVIRIPILADVDKYYHRKYNAQIKGKIINIGYTGSLSYKKDGIGELIKAIGILVYNYSINNVQLNIYGSGYKDTIKKIEKKIVLLQLEKHITFHGSVRSDKIPDILRKQDILVLPRPSNLQTRFGFSTKLAEYMASSVPLLMTNISDNAIYVQNNKNGFVIDKPYASDIAKKLKEIIMQKRYQDSKLRQNAYLTAKKYFNGNNYSDILVKFLFSAN